jgi:hypothetical protein
MTHKKASFKPNEALVETIINMNVQVQTRAHKIACLMLEQTGQEPDIAEIALDVIRHNQTGLTKALLDKADVDADFDSSWKTAIHMLTAATLSLLVIEAVVDQLETFAPEDYSFAEATASFVD